MKIKKIKLREIIREEFINFIVERICEKYRLNEEFSANDYRELKDLIRSELAAILFDLFKKRNVWI